MSSKYTFNDPDLSTKVLFFVASIHVYVQPNMYMYMYAMYAMYMYMYSQIL